MKKLLSFALVLVLCLSLAVPAFAVTPVTNVTTNNTDTHNILATTNITDAGIVYSVNIDWGAMKFTYTKAQGTWTPDDLDYTGAIAGIWTPANTGDNYVKVMNRSNAPIHAVLAATIPAEQAPITAAIANGDTFDLITLGGTFGTAGAGVLDLQTADNTLGNAGARAETYGSFAISLDGEPDGTLDTDTVIGSLTVTITAGA